MGANKDEPAALRTALIAAQRCTLIDPATGLPMISDSEVRNVMDEVIAPQLDMQVGGPKRQDLTDLTTVVRDIVDAQMGAVLVAQQVDSQQKATAGRKQVGEALGTHRKRLAYRQRNAVKAKAPEVIELREAEKCGAEWDRAKLSKGQSDLIAREVVEKTPVQAAFDAFDIDNDGTITIDEVIQFLLSVPPEQRPTGLKDVNPFAKKAMRRRIEKMDTDNDGTLSF